LSDSELTGFRQIRKFWALKNPSGLDFFASFFDQAKKGGGVGATHIN
jgi:hypothetical protein